MSLPININSLLDGYPTEGRVTGKPIILGELKRNGSPKATIETDDERTFFLIEIPCHPDFTEELLQGIENISLNRLKRKYIGWLLDAGLIAMTIPDKPTSKYQKYIITQLGSQIIKKRI